MQQRLALLFACAIAGACSSSSEESAPQRDETPAEPKELVVFAASSLREAFEDVGRAFEKDQAARVVFNFAGSQELRTQIEAGARADVFASADEAHMEALQKTRKVGAARAFAKNEPVVVVHRSSRSTIATFADLPKAGRIVIGAPDVPIGRYTTRILDRASTVLGGDFRGRVEARVVSRELNVRQVLAKVQLGEVDAGIVYRTDARVAAEVETIDIPAEINVVATYPIAAVEGTAEPRLAGAFVDFVLSESGQERQRRAGFLPVKDPASPRGHGR